MADQNQAPLHFLVGDEIAIVGFAWYDLHLSFAKGATITVYTEVHHTSQGETRVWSAGTLPADTGLLSLLGNAEGRPANPVVGVESEPDGDLVIAFARGDALRVKKLDAVEAYSIRVPDGPWIVG